MTSTTPPLQDPGGAERYWLGAEIESSASRGCAMALDATRQPMLAHWADAESDDCRLLFSRRVDGQWGTEIVHRGRGSACAMAVDAAGEPWIAFFDAATRALRLARKHAGDWAFEIVAEDLGGFAAGDVAIARSASAIAVSYMDLGPCVAWRQGADWRRERIDDGVDAGHGSGVTIAPDGSPRVCYVAGHGRRLVAAWLDGGSWQKVTVLERLPGGFVAEPIALAEDRDGVAHAACWTDAGCSYVRFHWLAHPAPSFEVVRAGDEVGTFPALALDAHGEPFVLYQNVPAGAVEFASRSADVWRHLAIARFAPDSDGGSASALSVDSFGVPHIAFVDPEQRRVRYVAGHIPPRPVGDRLKTRFNQPVSGNVLTNDTDPDGGVLHADPETVTQPKYGQVEMRSDGTVTYTPKKVFRTRDEFLYDAVAPSGLRSAANVEVVMRVPISPEFALATVAKLLGLAGRIDSILALRQASRELPFALPPAPQDSHEHLDEMMAFFAEERGQLVLELRDRTDDLEQVQRDPHAGEHREARRRLFELFYEVGDRVPIRLGPHRPERVPASTDARLSYYVVTSERLSRNSAFARVLLATADSIMELVGARAHEIFANERTARVVETLLGEFAGARDFDDASTSEIFRGLLGAVITTAAQHGDEFATGPAVGALIHALADFRNEFGDESAAVLLSLDGFNGLLGKFATHVAGDARLLPDDPRLARVLAATLREVGHRLPAMLEDPAGMLGVLEVTMTAGAAEVETLLEGRIEDRPIIPAVLVALAAEIETRGREHALLRQVADGSILAALLRTSLATVAARPEELATSVGIDAITARLVADLAGLLANRELSEVFTVESLQEVVRIGLAVLAEHPELLASDDEFAAGLTAAVIRSTAAALADGLAFEDLENIVRDALEFTTGNVRLLELGPRLTAIVEATGAALAEQPLRRLSSAAASGRLVLDVLRVVAANPAAWNGIARADLARPLVVAVVGGLATDPSRLLSGSVLTTAAQDTLRLVGRHADAFVRREIPAPEVRRVVELALRAAKAEVGSAVDGENLPRLLQRVLRAAFAALESSEPVTPASVRRTLTEALDAAERD